MDDIIISKVIAHKLNLNGDKVILGETPINFDELRGNDEALKFFRTHIEQTREQGFVKRCQFWDLKDNIIKKNIEKIISNFDNTDKIDNVFVEESQKMAVKLRKAMKSSSSRSDGSLFVLLYTKNGQNFIGLLKMDPDTGVEVLDDLTIVVREEMLPSMREKLHKAALILCKDDYNKDELHLFALDRQKSSAEPAKYFMDNFLNVKVLPDDKNLTVEYQKEMTTTFKDILPKDIFMEFNNNFKRRLLTGDYFTIDDDFAPLVRDLLPVENRDADLEDYKRRILGDLVRKLPGEVTGFKPYVEKINPTLFQSSDRTIEIKILPGADESVYEKKYEEDGTFILTVYPEAEIEEKK